MGYDAYRAIQAKRTADATDALVRHARRAEMVDRGVIPASATVAEADTVHAAATRKAEKDRREAARQHRIEHADSRMAAGITIVVALVLVPLAVLADSGIMWWFTATVVLACVWGWVTSIGDAKTRREQQRR